MMATTASDRNVGTLGAVPVPPPRAGSFVDQPSGAHDAGSNNGSAGRAFSRSNSASSTGSITRSLSFTRTRKFVRGDSMTLNDARHIVESSINSYAGSLKFHAVQMILMEHFPVGDLEKPHPPEMPENTLIIEDLKEPGPMPERLKPAITYFEKDPTPPPSPKKKKNTVRIKLPTQDERFGAFNISAPAATNVKEEAAKGSKDANEGHTPGAQKITKVASKQKLPAAEKDGAVDESVVKDSTAKDTDRNVESSPFFKASSGAGRPGFRRMLSRNRSLRKVTEDIEKDTTPNANNDNASDSEGEILKRTTSQKKYPDRASLGVKPANRISGIAGAPSPSPRVSLPIFGRKERDTSTSGDTAQDTSSGTPGFFAKMGRPRADSTADDSLDAEDRSSPVMPKNGVARSMRKVISSFRTPRARTFIGKLRKNNNNNSNADLNNADGPRSKNKKKTSSSIDRGGMFEDRAEANPRQGTTNGSTTEEVPTSAQRRKMMPRVQSGGSLFKETGSKIRKLSRSASAISINSGSRKKDNNISNDAAESTTAKKKEPEAADKPKGKVAGQRKETNEIGVKSVPNNKKKVVRSSPSKKETQKASEKAKESGLAPITIMPQSSIEGNTTSAASNTKEKEMAKSSSKKKAAKKETSRVTTTKSSEQGVPESENKSTGEFEGKTSKKKTSAKKKVVEEDKVSNEQQSSVKKGIEKSNNTSDEITTAPSKKANEEVKKVATKKKAARVIRKAPEKTVEEVSKASAKKKAASKKEIDKTTKKAVEETLTDKPKKEVEEITKAPSKVSADSETASTAEVSKKKMSDELRKTRVKAADEGRRTFTKLPESGSKTEKSQEVGSTTGKKIKKEAPAKEALDMNDSGIVAVRSSSRVAELRKSFMEKNNNSETNGNRVTKMPKMPQVPNTAVRKTGTKSGKKEVSKTKTDEDIVAKNDESRPNNNKFADIVEKEINVDKVVEAGKKETKTIERRKALKKRMSAANKESMTEMRLDDEKSNDNNDNSNLTKRSLTSTSDKDEIISKIISQTEAPLEDRATSELHKASNSKKNKGVHGLAGSESRKVRMPGSGREAFLFDLPVEEVGANNKNGMKKSKSRAKKSKSRRGGFGRMSRPRKENKKETNNTNNNNIVAASGEKEVSKKKTSPVPVQ